MVSSAIAGSATLACCIVTGIFSALFVSSNTNSLDQTRNYQIAADQVTIHEIQEDTDGFWAWVSSGRYSWVDTCVGIFVGFIISQWLLPRQKKGTRTGSRRRRRRLKYRYRGSGSEDTYTGGHVHRCQARQGSPHLRRTRRFCPFSSSFPRGAQPSFFRRDDHACPSLALTQSPREFGGALGGSGGC